MAPSRPANREEEETSGGSEAAPTGGTSRWIPTWWPRSSSSSSCKKSSSPFHRMAKTGRLVPKARNCEVEDDGEENEQDEEKWPVFTTQVSKCVNRKSKKDEPFVRYFNESTSRAGSCFCADEDEHFMSGCSHTSPGYISTPSSLASLLPLRTLQHHLAVRTTTTSDSAMANADLSDTSDFTYTKLNCSNSAMSELAEAAGMSHSATETSSLSLHCSSQHLDQTENGSAGQVESNCSDHSSSSASSSAGSTSSWTPKFSSPFRGKASIALNRFRKPKESPKKSNAISREELVRLFILKLDEEANYFKVTSSPDEEFCDCHKCQRYYGEYYAGYLDEYERRLQGQPHLSIQDIEASILSDEIINNGINFCTIM